MMRKICLVFVFIMLNLTGFSQNSDAEKFKREEFSKENTEQIIDKNTSALSTDSINLIIDRINNINNHIKAIDTKVDYVNSNPVKKEKAEKEGWFNDMQKIKEELIMERTSLKSKLSQTTIK